jgi:hypothetical protein
LVPLILSLLFVPTHGVSGTQLITAAKILGFADTMIRTDSTTNNPTSCNNFKDNVGIVIAILKVAYPMISNVLTH